jgi:hypothetical protein
VDSQSSVQILREDDSRIEERLIDAITERYATAMNGISLASPIAITEVEGASRMDVEAEGKEEDRSMATVKLTVLVGIAAVAGIVIGRISLLSRK